MQVLLINGSPNAHGCTDTALREVARAIEAEGLGTEILHIGKEPIRGCIGCGGCARGGKQRCVFGADGVNAAIEKALQCDALVIGSPVHYAAASGGITSFMDRFFYAAGAQMAGKVGAAVVSARRAGTTSALEQLQKYFAISGMPVAPSQYWPMVHGRTPEEVLRDEEGLQIMRHLGRYIAYMVKSFSLAREAGILPPQRETPTLRTNFIR